MKIRRRGLPSSLHAIFFSSSHVQSSKLRLAMAQEKKEKNIGSRKSDEKTEGKIVHEC